MKTFKIWGVVVVMMVALLVPALPAMAQEPEWFVYQPGGEKCEMADMEVVIYIENDRHIPPGLRKTLAKCEKYAKVAAVQKRPASKNRKLIGFFE